MGRDEDEVGDSLRSEYVGRGSESSQAGKAGRWVEKVERGKGGKKNRLLQH